MEHRESNTRLTIEKLSDINQSVSNDVQHRIQLAVQPNPDHRT